MATQVQLRGGTTSEHSSFTGAAREVTVDTDKDVVVVHDGSTAGGIPLAKEASVLPLAGGTMTGDVSLGDNVKAKFGAGNDLQIYSDGTSSYIKETSGAGSLFVDADFLTFRSVDGTETKAKFQDNGYVKLYHNNAQKLATTTTGIDVTGSVTCDGFTSTGIDDNATSTAITIDAAENVGVGTTSPASALHVVDSGNPTLTISGSAGAYTSILKLQAAGGGSSIINATGATSDNLILQTNDTERMRVLSSGGITFNGDTAAANALDDYEEGTWTPGLMTSSVNLSSVTYHTGVNGGRYTKIGSRVFLTGTLYTTAVTIGSATGNVGINGLPFTPATSSLGQNGMESATISEVDGWVTNNPDGMRIEHGSTYIRMFYRATSNGASVDIAAAHISTAANRNLVRFAISYETA